ncbi:MAG: efflux RND transporter periplasmic adaptor subunit [Planctomycetia bacterium]|nr:efflux RND transporter periplasmic adaptor subunit [Planctomycetia bacterium]
MKKCIWVLSVLLLLAIAWVFLSGRIHLPTSFHNHDSCGHDHSHEGHDHEGHEHEGHDHEGHDDHAAIGKEDIVLSRQAMENIGLGGDDAMTRVQPQTFSKAIFVPAMVEEYPGRTQTKIPSPVSGVITKIYHEPGVAVSPGEPLFDIQLTHPAVLEARAKFMELLKKGSIIDSETERIGELPEGLAPKSKRDLAFQKAELETQIENQKNLLRVQGITDEQIGQLAGNPDNMLLSVTVNVPQVSHHGIVSKENPGHVKNWVTFYELNVQTGQVVTLGDPLCTLCDLCELAIRGEAFAYDENALLEALRNKFPLTARFEGEKAPVLRDLKLRSMGNHINEDARTISCYVDFENEIAADHTEKGDFATPRHYIQWKFKPGQRCVLQIPYETMENVLVLPADAVAQEVAETFVFVYVGDDEALKIWRKTPVHVVYREKENVLVSPGDLPPNAQIATRGASFLLAALNQRNNGGAGKIDPHAGHNH